MTKRIVIMDFDGTLIDTETPEKGKDVWLSNTGEVWPHKGWWGRPESLNMDVFDCKPISKVREVYHQEKDNDTTLMVMMTGRIKKLQKEVKKILDTNNLHFNTYYYNDFGTTIEFKINKLNYLLKQHPGLESMSIWEDRVEHAEIFKNWGSKQKDILVDVHIV